MSNELQQILVLVNDYCSALQHTSEMEKDEFVNEILGYLPQIYWHFFSYDPSEEMMQPDYGYYPSYVDEDFYESIRHRIGVLMGEDDVFLETFEEDMKYSDTPIAASISESLADIFQPLYNFLITVRKTEGAEALGAYIECRENFGSYWSQTLCNVMRALNNIKYGNQ